MQSKAVLLRVRETSIKSWSKKKKRFTGPSILRLSVRPVFHGKASECEHEEMLLEQFNVILLLLLLLHTCVVLCHDNTTLETPGTHFIFVSVGSPPCVLPPLHRNTPEFSILLMACWNLDTGTVHARRTMRNVFVVVQTGGMGIDRRADVVNYNLFGYLSSFSWQMCTKVL